MKRLSRFCAKSFPEHTGQRQEYPNRSLASEMDLLKQYNEALFRKLRKKMDDLETANLTLEREIEKRQSIETSLRQMEERFRTVLDTLPVGLLWTDPSGRMQYLNRTFGELFGYVLSDLPTLKEWFW